MIGGRNILGAGVNPNAFKYDFSGAYEIGKAYARGIEGAGEGIAKSVEAIGKTAGDYFKQQGEKKKLIKQADLQIDAAIKLFPDLAQPLESARNRIKDENNPLNDRAAEAEVAASIINMGIGEMRNRANMSFEQQKFAADQEYRQAGLGMQAAELGVRQQAAQQAAESEAAKRTEGEISIFDPESGREIKERVWKDDFGNAYDYDTKRPIIDTEKYFRGEEGGMGELQPTSQYDATGISNALSMVGTPDVSIKSSIPKVNIPYNGVPAPNRYNNPGGAYPSEKFLKYGLAGKGVIGDGHPVGYYPNIESGIAANMAHFKQMKPVGKTVGEMRHYWTKGKWGGRTVQPGMDTDEVITQEKLNDPEWMGKWMRTTASAEGFRGSIPDEKIASGFKFYQSGGVPQGPSQTSQSVPTVNLSDSITRVGEIIPEIGMTPSQQSDLASQIEQGQNLQTAQAGGGMPTELRLNQQPQPAQRPIVRGVPVGGGQQQQGTIMNAEQVKNLTDRGFKVDAIPTNDGNFTVSGVTAGGQTPRYTKTPQEELETRRLTNLDQLQSDVRATGVSAAQDIAPFKEIVGLLDASVKTGFGRQTLMTAKKILGADVSNEEQFQARVGELAMRNIALTKGAISDREMDYFKTVLSPNMGKTTEGNKKIIEFKLKYAERAATIAKIISKMQSQNADPYVIQSEIDKIIESTPLVTVGSTPTSPSSQAEADASFLQGFQSGE